MVINSKHGTIHFVVENEAFEGVKRVAVKVASDVTKVCGNSLKITDNILQHFDGAVILFATSGKSPLLERLITEGKYNPAEIRGKREVYQVKFIENPFPGTNQILLICGSDKRGTIYGMFSLSEYIGVSPLHFWGDAEPNRHEIIEINRDIEIVSKEPSVKYRGFFINDEWPCFGNWTFSHFGGFTCEMYDHVFELLLRLKGNYLWPAMWSSSFPLDGPGNKNEELADIYGVVMGASHHEPCLRASEEWDKVRGPESVYGNEWNYYTNREGLLSYWEDSLKRSGKYEHIITIGMRGERDSSMLGSNSTLKDNIELLKDIIINQRRLIKEHVNEDIDKVPQLLALYKEVEQFFYGDETAEGLKNWDELESVICMLCEDNFGFMRTLPDEEIRNRKGGFGMYYHFDYHGGPVSYEWMPSTPFSKVWEQMCMAYDYGIRDVWIVNVGDLKFNEVPLAYFLSLAYDFEKWGTNAPGSWKDYTKAWLKNTFPKTDNSLLIKMEFVLEQYICINGMRRPETQNADTYHPCNYLEADRMLGAVLEIEKANEEVYEQLNGNEKDAYYSMIYFPAKSSINLLRMNLYAGKNAHYAAQGKTVANKYAELVTECIKIDRSLADEFSVFKDGKWKGMELEAHIGFTKWNDDNYRYPPRIYVEPVHKPRMKVSRKDSEFTAVKNYGPPMSIEVNDFLYEGNKEVVIEIANDGIGHVNYTIETESGGEQFGWLSVTPLSGSVETQAEVILRCDREKLPVKEQCAKLIIKDGETTIAVLVKGKAVNKALLPEKTFLENNGIITMEANHFCKIHNTVKGSFCELSGYGRSGCGMKVFPTTVDFNENEDKPSLSYRFFTEHAGEHIIEVWAAPTNSVKNKRPLRFMLTEQCGKTQILTLVTGDFMAGDNRERAWCDGVLKNIRVVKASAVFEKGVGEITIGALEAGFVLERILIYRNGNEPKVSYLGPEESFFID